MLLLLANQILVVIGADSLAVIQRSRGIGTRVIDQKHRYFPQEKEMRPVGSPIWQEALRQLDSVLATMKISSRTQLKIILASDFVRYLSLPAQQVHMSQEEKLAYAVAAYHEVYGSAVDTWSIRLNDTAPRQSTIVAALDKGLLEELNQLAARYQVKLVSTQPYLMSAFNALFGQIKNTTGYLAIVELKRLLLVSLQAGKCQNLRVFSLSVDWQSELQNLLERELLLAEESSSALLIYAPTQKHMAFEAIKDWQLKRIVTKNNTNNRHLAMLEVAL